MREDFIHVTWGLILSMTVLKVVGSLCVVLPICGDIDFYLYPQIQRQGFILEGKNTAEQ